MRIPLIALAMLATLPVTTACAEPPPDDQAPTVEPVENVLTLAADDTISWNGEQVTLDQLEILLEETAKLDPQPQLRFVPEIGAGYEVSAVILQRVKESGVKFGFVGNEKYRMTREED